MNKKKIIETDGVRLEIENDVINGVPAVFFLFFKKEEEKNEKEN